MKNKKSKRYSVSVFISGLLCILFLTTACKYRNNVKEFIEMEIAGGKSDDLVFYDEYDVSANGKTYVPSQKPITGTIPIENEYSLELSAQMFYDESKKALFEARPTVDTAASTPTEIKFTFQFKQDADASTQHPVGQEVPVTVTLIKKLNGTVFATKKFTIRCNTKPGIASVTPDTTSDVFTVILPTGVTDGDIKEARCTLKYTAADGSSQTAVYTLPISKFSSTPKQAHISAKTITKTATKPLALSARTLSLVLSDYAGLSSPETQSNNNYIYSSGAELTDCKLNVNSIDTAVSFTAQSADPHRFSASVPISSQSAVFNFSVSPGATLTHTGGSYDPTNHKITITDIPPSGKEVSIIVTSEDEKTENTYTLTVHFALYVDGTQPNAWQKLKSAVAAAVDGDTIIINGTIKATTDTNNNGEIIINKNLTVKGKTDKDSDKLDAAGLSRIFNVQAGKTLTIQNLTLTGGKTTGNENGGGIYTEGTVRLENCTIQNCTTTGNGGGIYAKTTSDVTNVIKGGSKIQNNSAALGGGIYIEAAPGVHCTVSAETSDITENNGSTGAGVYIAENGEFSINGGSVAKNTGSGPGKGVYVTGESSGLQYTQGGSFSIKNAAIIGSWDNNGNLTDDNDVYLGMNSMAAMLTRITTENLSAAKVARITPASYTVGTQVLAGTINGNNTKFIVTANGSEKWKIAADGTLQKESGGTATTTVSSWTELKAAVENSSGTDTITISGTLTATAASDTIKVSRTVTIQGTDKATCILDANTKCRIFTIDSTGTNGNLTLKNLTLQNGIASGTGQGGGAIYCNASKLTAENIIIKSCRSENSRGGAIYAKELSSSPNNILSTISLKDVEIMECMAPDGNGGGLYCQNTKLSIFGSSKIIKCSALSGGALYIKSTDTVSINLTDTEISNNKAHKAGGAVYVGNLAPAAQLVFTNCTFEMNGIDINTNSAGKTHSGGALFLTSSHNTGGGNVNPMLKLTDCTFEENYIGLASSVTSSNTEKKGATIYIADNSNSGNPVLCLLVGTLILDSEFKTGTTSETKLFGSGIFVGKNTVLEIDGNSQVESKTNGTVQNRCDIYLTANNGAPYEILGKIKCTAGLGSEPIGQITPGKYQTGLSMFTNTSQIPASRFTVTDESNVSKWEVDTDGKLKKK
ncbi:MAG: hypothetical protein P1P63_09910 [Treponemataceae bacterium]